MAGYKITFDSEGNGLPITPDLNELVFSENGGFVAHVGGQEIPVSVGKTYVDTAIANGPGATVDAYTKAESDAKYCLETSFETHTRTDQARWQDYYNTQTSLNADVIALEGKMIDMSNAASISNDTTFTCNDELGGSLMILSVNSNGNFTTLTINGQVKYSTEGIMDGLPLVKTYVVKNGDVIVIHNAETVTEYYPYIADPNATINIVVNDLSKQADQIASLQQQILDLKASMQNKVPDTANAADIVNTTYTVVNALGGQLVGKGATTLGLLGIKVASTGTVTVNGANVYDNTSLLGTGATETLTVDVFEGDVIVSSGMSTLTFTPYVYLAT